MRTRPKSSLRSDINSKVEHTRGTTEMRLRVRKGKHGTDEPIYRTQTDSPTWRADLWLPRGREWDRLSLGLLDANYYI